MILLFGSNGQLGQELVRAAAPLHAMTVHALPRGEVDIADRAAVGAAFTRWKPVLVVNAAAYTKVDQAETDVDEARRANEIGPAVIASACADAQIAMVHISTDYVFDGTKRGAYMETDAVCPINVYGRTKAAGEDVVRRALKSHIILRTAWVYSAFGHNFLKTIVRLAATQDELRVVADQYGSPTSAGEIANAILRIAPRLMRREQVWGTYHFTSNGVTTWYELANRIVAAQARFTGHNPRVTPVRSADYKTSARRPANSQLDCRFFAHQFGFSGRPWAEDVESTTIRLVAASQQAVHVA
jgi:dTDP-4-dehydrorhamnose reductase